MSECNKTKLQEVEIALLDIEIKDVDVEGYLQSFVKMVRNGHKRQLRALLNGWGLSDLSLRTITRHLLDRLNNFQLQNQTFNPAN